MSQSNSDVKNFIPNFYILPILGMDVVWKDRKKSKGIYLTHMSGGCLHGCLKWLHQKGYRQAHKVLSMEVYRRINGRTPPNFEKVLAVYQSKPETWHVQVTFYITTPN